MHRFVWVGWAVVLLLGTSCSIERTERPVAQSTDDVMTPSPLLGLRSGIYHVADLAAARAWYVEMLGYQPYFDEEHYVGFDVDGFELGLDSDTTDVQPGAGGAVLYWGVASVDSALVRLLELGAVEIVPAADVGADVRHAVVRDPFGNVFGIIENPHFTRSR
jgi:catechol 2,3-dioxygenase-like lactoylglutathione lyase family enzyme